MNVFLIDYVTNFDDVSAFSITYISFINCKNWARNGEMGKMPITELLG